LRPRCQRHSWHRASKLQSTEDGHKVSCLDWAAIDQPKLTRDTFYSELNMEQIFFFKDGPFPASFSIYFHLFLQYKYWKMFSSQLGSNSDHRSTKQIRWPLRHNHGPGTNFFCSTGKSTSVSAKP
jgi:hypothetical protein